jgi:hypothetical protein
MFIGYRTPVMLWFYSKIFGDGRPRESSHGLNWFPGGSVARFPTTASVTMIAMDTISLRLAYTESKLDATSCGQIRF